MQVQDDDKEEDKEEEDPVTNSWRRYRYSAKFV